MKKDEAISILATSARPREPKNRTRYDEAVKMAIEALRQPEPKWIPVSERLPEEEICFPEEEIAFREVGATMSEAVIITVKTQDKFYTDIGYTKNGQEWICEAEGYKVIAWMPLPEPYREREAAND